ncbi:MULTISPECIES: alpha/beta fold hydrolase [Bacillaceae]|uniref:Alpha/beta hydrolase n=1 Tax=Evansella alkalicola TaxID=745819 RepID=A0ABS6JR61_9BACI|nr:MULTISPECIES: alpha/beta hydrolase [Bacillaceae]MBU9721044.1 alpha/beta hydrolase [Bacillus alkalicola]
MWKREVQLAKGVFVIVHGAGEYHVRYNWVVDQLNKLNFHVIIGDLPGQGTTEGPRGHVDRFQQYIEVVSGWLKEAKKYQLPVYLLAHSMGGLISIHTLMALTKNDLPNVVVLSSPCLGLKNDPPFYKRTLSHVLDVISPGFRFPSGLEPGSGTRDEWMRKRDLGDNKLIKHVSVRWYKELVRAMNKAHEQKASFPDIPLLVTQAGNDLIVKKEMAKSWFDGLNITNKYYKEWPNLYHEVLNEPEKAEVLAHLIGFISIQDIGKRE